MKYFLLLLLSLQANAKLLDKIVGVLDNQVYTLAEIKRIKSNASARKLIAPLIYKKSKYSDKEVLDILFQSQIVSKKLAELGIVVNDSMVNERVEQIEKAQGVSRSFLINYLRTQNLNFNEYFSLIKQMIEISYFNSRVIAPLVSISDSEVSSLQASKRSKTRRNMIYNVVNYAFNPAVMKKYSNSEIIKFLTDYRNNSTPLPSELADLSSSDLSLESATLNKEIYNVLRKTNKGKFSKPKVINSAGMIFFMKSKKYSKNNSNIASSNQVKQELLVKKSSEAIKKWIESEKANHYLKVLI